MARTISGRKPARQDAKASGSPPADFRPSREEVLRYIEENPDKSGKRDIAKAFSLKGEDRIWLKDLLADLHEEGAVTKERKRMVRAGALPPVAMLEIFARDDDGTLLARPTDDRMTGDAPTVVAIRVSRSAGVVPGVGDRVMAKTFRNKEEHGPAYTGRVIRIFDKRSDAVLGVLRVAADGSLRIDPVERGKPELVVAEADRHGAVSGDLVEVTPASSGRYGLPRQGRQSSAR